MNNNIFKNLRLDVGMTQKELGDAVGLSPTAIARYEKGSRIPKPEIIEKLADVLNVTPGTLVFEEGWCEKYNVTFESTKEIEHKTYIKEKYGDDSIEILELLNTLNFYGRKKVATYIIDIHEKYMKGGDK